MIAADFADLHRHLGGAVHPKVLFGYLQSDGPDAGVTPPERETIRQLLARFPTYPDLKRHFATRQPTLLDYLELHTLVEPIQTPGAMGYFIYRIIRGARIFEQTSLLELRFSPYLRTDPNLDVADRMLAMEAVLEAARLRLRPILMTSLAFIAGVVPLVIATGAGAEMRHAMGIAVFAGMLGVTVFGLFLTPVFYFVVQWFADRWTKETQSPKA